jgi:putative transcriptional regulator
MKMIMLLIDRPQMLKWRLREVMARGKITNRELAQELGRHEGSISRMKNAEQMPRIDGAELNDLCNALTRILQSRGGSDVVVTHKTLLEYFPDSEISSEATE